MTSNITLIVLIVLIALILLLSPRIAHPFLSRIVIFRYIDFDYWFSLFTSFPSIIERNTWPSLKHYYQPEYVQLLSNPTTQDYQALQEMVMRNFNTPLAKYNYTIDTPTLETLHYGHNKDIYLSCFSLGKRISMMMMTPVNIKLGKSHTYGAYYGDYLCTEKAYRKNGYGAKLYYSTAYALHEKGTQVFLSKKEGHPLPLVVPLLKFKTYVYDMTYWKAEHNIKAPFQMKTLEHLRYVDVSLFANQISVGHENIEELIKIGYMKFFSLSFEDKVIALFCFKDPHFMYKKGKAIECFATIVYEENREELIRNAFLHILVNELREKQNYSVLLMEELAHNVSLYRFLKKKYLELYSVWTYYYIYNLKMKTIRKKDSFICLP